MGGVLISVIGCGRREGTRKCLMRVLATTPRSVELVLTDNASKDGTGEMFEETRRSFPERTTVFREPENTGFIPPGNRSFHLSVTRGHEFTILLNDDTDPPDGWLEKLLAPFAEPQVALSCPHGTCCTLDHAFNGFGGDAFEYCEGSCVAIRNSAIRSFSPTLFDENLTGIYGDDSNLSLRAREKGWKIARAEFDMPHIRSATTRSPEVSEFCDYHKKKNHEYNVHRWQHYLQVRHFHFPIVLRRSYAIGDVLLLTPIIKAIAQSNPLSPIHVQTNYPELFARNPHVMKAGPVASQTPADALFIDLDGSYEGRTMTHIVEAYADTVREHLPGLGPVELKTQMFPGKQDMEWATQKRAQYGSKLAIIGSDPSTWPSKNWEQDKFLKLRSHLHNQGWSTVAVGSKKAEISTTFHQVTALASLSQLFVGIDSAPLHFAQSAGCPTVGIFGPTLPRMILTQTSKAAAAVAHPAIRCAGQRHRVTGKTYVECSPECIQSVTVEDVIKAIERLGLP